MISFKSHGKFKPLYVDDKTIYVAKNRDIYYSTDNSYKLFEKICSIPISLKFRILIKFRFFVRMFRLEPRAAYLTTDNILIVSFCGYIYEIDIKKKVLQKVHSFRKGMNNPLNFCEIKDIAGFKDSIVYGEYWGNPDKQPVAIYGRINKKWLKLFEFPDNTITHIHSIIPDKKNKRLLILTGDKDKESGIWAVYDNFNKIESLLVGAQSFRSCVAIPVEEGILFATDTPFEENYIGIIKENKDNKNCKISKYCSLEGPCINYCKVQDKYYFSTCVEPDSTGILNNPKSNYQKYKYLLSYKLGKGVKSRFCTLISGDCESGFYEISRLKKDGFPITLFGFGNISFPLGKDINQLIIYPQSIKNYDGLMLIGNNESGL